jgi:DedD protein
MTTNIADVERGVSGSHEPSYYEIALTNRQVVVAFVILLTCVVAAFLSGVWIGRESVVRAQEKMALLAHAGPAAGAGGGDAAAGGAGAADKEKPEGQALQEFKFFADSRQRRGRSDKAATTAKSPPSAPEPQPGVPRGAAAPSTLADDLSRRAGSSSAAPPPQGGSAAIPSAASTPTSQTAARGAASGPQDNAARSSRSAQPAHPAPPADIAAQGSAEAAGEGEALPAPSRKPGAAARAPGGLRDVPPTHPGEAAEVVIQVFSTADKEQADKVREGLLGAGLTAFLSPIAKNGQTMYRVRIGPFPSRAAAEPVAEKVRKEHKLDTWITPK